MGKIKEFKITVAEDKAFYYAGDEISGTVQLDLNEPFEMLRLILILKGRGKCTAGSKCVEDILELDVNLFGCAPKTHGKNTIHPAGQHSYPFLFKLPESLPSSAVESNGFIKYNLKAQITYKGIKGFISKNWKVKSILDIKERIDPNLPEDRMQPIVQLHKTGGLFSNAKKLEKHDLLVSTQRGVFCPGENINIHIQYKDGVARKMGTVKAKLNKYVLYNPKENKQCYSTKKIVNEVTDTNKSNEKIDQRVISIKVPSKSNPTNILKNSVVINYIIHVKVDGYPEMKIPVIIGTIEFDERKVLAGIMENEEEQQPSENPNYNTNPTKNAPAYTESPPEGHSQVLHASSLYPDLYIPENEFDLPPPYEESVATAPQIN